MAIDFNLWQRVVVLGGGGTLGSALLAETLVAGRFAAVHALAAGPWPSTLRGLKPLTAEQFAQHRGWAAELAFVVFERGRHANGRDQAFVMPALDELPGLARTLREGGVRRLVVVLPHAPALLPQALKAGLATLDETAVAALGFEHLVFVRAAQALVAAPAGGRVQRFAGWWLSQLSWMVPQREQPQRAVVLAALVVALARLLPQLPAGTRVLPPEVLGTAAADGDAAMAERLAAWWRQGALV